MADAVAIFTPGQRLVGTDGVPYSGASAAFYSAGTDNPLTVYANSDLTVSLGTIVYSDSTGYPVTASGGTTKTQVFTGTLPYKVVIKDGSGVIVVTHDNCVGAVVAGSGGGATGITQAQGDVRYTRNANALTASASIVDADIFPFWNVSGAANKGLTFANLKTKLTTDFRADGRMFPVGTRMPFQQTTPSVGWTKEVGATYNDATLRFSTGTVGVGGTQSFNTTFASRTSTGAVGATTLTAAGIPTHNHTAANVMVVNAGSSNAAGGFQFTGTAVSRDTDFVGSSGSHFHSLTMNADNFDVKHVEMSIGAKA